MYETFYKLSGKPFQPNPDPLFFFASKGHSRAFAYLKYGIYQGDGFIVITGDIGAGKTTMVQTLLNEIDSDQIVAAQLVSTQLDADDLVQAVASAFGLPIKNLGKAEMLAQFEAFLNRLVAGGRRALLIVDEAQNLNPRAMEELRMLSNFQNGTRSLLQTFLVGQPELREMLRDPSMTQLRQRIIASYHLGPMDKSETRAYVLHRLALVDWADDPKLGDEIFSRLYHVTGGLPRVINSVCNRLFLGAFMGQKHAIGITEFEETITEMRDEIGSDAVQPESRENAGMAPPFISQALAPRLDRIEKGVAAAVELLQQFANPDVPAGTTRAGERRPRFGARPPPVR